MQAGTLENAIPTACLVSIYRPVGDKSTVVQLAPARLKANRMSSVHVWRCRPAALRFQRNGSGKPALTWPAALEHCNGAALHFNLSHTRGLMGEA